MISLLVNGQIYSTWTSIEVERSLEALAGIFKFVAVTSQAIPFPIKPGQPCTVLINNKSVIVGYVDKVEIKYSASEHTYTVEGRDRTCDIVDDTVDHKIEFKGTISLDTVISTTLAHINCSFIPVINQVPDLEPYSKTEQVSAKIGEKAFKFIEQYARKRQVLLTTDGLGSLVVTRASNVLSNISLLNVVGGTTNNIKTAEIKYDNSHRFHSYTFWSQGNPGSHGDSSNNDVSDAFIAAFNTDSDPVQGGSDAFADSQGQGEDQSEDTSPKQLVSRSGEYIDDEIRDSRVFNKIAESSSKKDDAQKRAQWEGQLRKAKSRVYKATVVGHGFSEHADPYMPNVLVTVNDDFVNVNEQLITLKVTSKISLEAGSTTELELVSAADLQLLLDAEYREKGKKGKKGKKGGGGSSGSNYNNDPTAYFQSQ